MLPDLAKRERARQIICLEEVGDGTPGHHHLLAARQDQEVAYRAVQPVHVVENVHHEVLAIYLRVLLVVLMPVRGTRAHFVPRSVDVVQRDVCAPVTASRHELHHLVDDRRVRD